MKTVYFIKTKWSNLKLETKLIIAFLLTILTGILIVASIIGFSTNYFFNDYVKDHNVQRASQWKNYLISYYIKNNYSWNGAQQVFEKPPLFRYRALGQGNGSVDRIILVGTDGKTLADSNDENAVGKVPLRLDEQTIQTIYVNNKQVGIVLLGVNTPPGTSNLEERFYKSVINATIIAFTIAIILALSLAFHFSRRISVPLKALNKAAQKLATKEYNYRLFIPWKDEIGSLARTFNITADAIEKNEQVRNQLIADVAHELRTPITILRGNLESLQVGAIDYSMDLVSSLHDEVLRLSRLINDLQEISLADSGKLMLNIKKVNSVELLKKIVNNFKGLSSNKKIKISLNFPNEEPIIEIDEDKITQVLSNIINNAIRHTPPKCHININLLVNKEKEICFSVVDSGPGIKPEDRPYIFNRFYRGDKSRSRSDGGSGLGLAIAESMVQAHGGKVEVQCPSSGGSIFTVFIPIKNKRN